MDTRIMDLFASAHVLEAALKVGLVQALQSGPLTAQAYAEKLGLDTRATTLVLDALVALDIASRAGDAYDASPTLKELLRPFAQGGFPMENLWGHVGTFLRTGEPLLRMDGAPAEREQSYRSTVSMLARLLEAPARELAAKLDAAPARVLDVGCGSGIWSLSIAERFPETHVTGQDLPAVLESFMNQANARNLTDRVATLPGDMHDVDLPAGHFDLVLIANVLRLEPPERAASLLARLSRAVAPGGALLVVDALASGTPERERAQAFYALNLALRTQKGRVHAPSEIQDWLRAAGFAVFQSIDFDSYPGAVGAILARK
jgi:ubiquinone/menaquinone biosynthesis C-methylase UbiE